MRCNANTNNWVKDALLLVSNKGFLLAKKYSLGINMTANTSAMHKQMWAVRLEGKH